MGSAIRVLTSFLLLSLTAIASPSHAQKVLIPGSLKGFGTMGPSGEYRLCSPLAIGLYDWRVEWVTRLVHPTDQQAALLRSLVADSAKARDLIADACRHDEIRTTTEQLTIMEARLRGLTGALETLRPSYEAFYSSLDSGQKARLDRLGPGRRGWGW
jgi:LTXXQ motif family protein